MATAYYASKISPNQFETPTEGYRICKNVPICRTGFQEYLGSELKKHPSYQPEWGLEDGETYKVYRPLDEVTSKETISTAEGKTIVDEHPPEHIAPGSLISIETERELNCGHVQNVRIGDKLPNGETPLLADMHIKNDVLIDKVDGGIRDISCGYTYKLKRLADGTLAQADIRINHVAVVPKGRAGPDVAIKDALPAEIKPKKGNPPMSILNRLLGLGLKTYATDASPEELANAVKEVGASTKDAEPEKKEKEGDVADKATKDAEALKTQLDAANKELEELRANDKAAKDKAAKDAAESALEELNDADETEKKEKEAEKDAEVLSPGQTLEGEKAGKAAAPSTTDAARAFVKVVKPFIASGTADKATVDSYNGLVKALNGSRGIDVYAGFASPRGEGHTGLDSMAAVPESPSRFFEGVPYKVGLKAYNDHLAATAKGGK